MKILLLIDTDKKRCLRKIIEDEIIEDEIGSNILLQMN